MLTCKQMSELASDVLDRRLNWRTRAAAMLHLRMCSRCSTYIRQIRLTSQVLQQLPLDHEPADSRQVLAQLDALRSHDGRL